MPDTPCAACGHPATEHAEFVDNGLDSTKEEPARRHCLHGVAFVKRVDYRGGMIVSSDKRACGCESYVSKLEKFTNGSSKDDGQRQVLRDVRVEHEKANGLGDLSAALPGPEDAEDV